MKILLSENIPIYQSSSFNRGAWTFTSLLTNSNRFLFLEDHLERLFKGAESLYPGMYFKDSKSELSDFLHTHFRPQSYYRINLIDDEISVLIKPHDPKPDFVNLAKAKSKKTLSLIPAYLKTPNYLLADLEIKEALKLQFDDVLFYDYENFAQEATTSNIFLVNTDRSITTPPTSSMVLEGVLRKNLLDFFLSHGLVVNVETISEEKIMNASELLLSNSVQGLRFVKNFNNSKMFNERKLYDFTCDLFGRFGENFK